MPIIRLIVDVPGKRLWTKNRLVDVTKEYAEELVKIGCAEITDLIIHPDDAELDKKNKSFIEEEE